MSMLSRADLNWMERTVRSIIKEWDTKITIYSKLPEDQQKNYNKLMREFTGGYICSKLEIDAERKDIVNNMTNDPSVDTLALGVTDDGTLLYALPNVIENDDGKIVQYKPTLFDIVDIGDGYIYYIRNIKDRIGETLITIMRFVGSTPSIIDNNGEITITDYDWGDSNGN